MNRTTERRAQEAVARALFLASHGAPEWACRKVEREARRLRIQADREKREAARRVEGGAR